MVLVTPEQLDRICPGDSQPEGASPAATPFRQLIRDLLLFFEHTYRVSSQWVSLPCLSFCTCHNLFILIQPPHVSTEHAVHSCKCMAKVRTIKPHAAVQHRTSSASSTRRCTTPAQWPTSSALSCLR